MKNNRLSILLIPVVVLLTLATAHAQTSSRAAAVSRAATASETSIRGRLVDASDRPVAGAAVVLFDRDSVYLDAVVSGADGQFEIRSAVRPYRLQIQHLAYEIRILESDRSDLGDIRLEEATTEVDAVVVEGELLGEVVFEFTVHNALTI